MSDSGPRMLRMVRWQSLQQDADRLRSWFDQDEHQALARTLNMGDPRTARRALLDWLRDETRKLKANPRSVPSDFARLKRLYFEFRSRIDGRLSVMDTELGYWSQNVGPEYDKPIHEYPTWANTANLGYLFGEGRECMMTGHMGTGKSHLAVSLMEYLLKTMKRPLVHIVTNISGIKDTSGEFADRIHHVSLLSEVLRIWSRLPEDCLIVLVIDEPEANLRGGSTKGVKVFNDFRYMLRKLGMSKLEIWHTEGEQYKSIREEKSEHVTRIVKTEKESFQVHRIMRGDLYRQEVTGVHELRFLKYAHRGMASIDIDVDMKRLIRSISKLYRVPEMKHTVKAALANVRYYLPEYRPNKDDADDAELSWEQVILRVLADVPRYLTQKRSMDAELIRSDFGLTYRDSRDLAREATQRWRDSTPGWQNVDGNRRDSSRKDHAGAGDKRPPRPRSRQGGDGDAEE